MLGYVRETAEWRGSPVMILGEQPSWRASAVCCLQREQIYTVFGDTPV